MDILTSGIFLLLTWSATVFGAFDSYRKNKFETVLFFLILGGALLRVWCACDPFLHAWDERYHMLVAKHLSENMLLPTLYDIPYIDYDYKAWTQNHFWVHKPPMTLWLMAISFKVFGVSEFTGRLPSIIMSVATIYLVYRIAVYLFKDKKIALITAFFQSVNGLVIELAVGRVPTDHVDTTFFFFMTLSIFFLLRYYRENKKKNLVFLGIAFGGGLLTKWLVAGTIMPMFLILFFSKKTIKNLIAESILILLIGFTIAVPRQFYIYEYFPLEAAWESKFNWMHFTQNIEEQAKPWWWLFDRARINWNEIIYIAWGWFLYEIFKRSKSREYHFLLVWILVPYTVFAIAISVMQGYVLFTAPAHFLIIALFISFLQKRKQQHWFFKILIAAFFVLAIRYGFERVKPFTFDSEKATQTLNIKKLSELLPKKSVVFNSPLAVEIRFYTNIPAYERMPTGKEVDFFVEKGFQIMVVGEPEFPEGMLEKIGSNRLAPNLEIVK